jgi:hypothetical protein
LPQIVCFFDTDLPASRQVSLIGSDFISYFSYEKQEMVLMSKYVFSEAKKHSKSV